MTCIPKPNAFSLAQPRDNLASRRKSSTHDLPQQPAWSAIGANISVDNPEALVLL